VLADQRYLAGDQLTLADVWMFLTLVRFHHCYHTAFNMTFEYTSDIIRL
jgi:putative glutathione S-transferase